MSFIKKNVAVLALIVVITITVTGCVKPQESSGDYTGEDDYIAVECPDQGQIKVSVAELMTLASVNEDVIVTDDDGKVLEEYSVEGVLLSTVLSHLEVSTKNLDTVRFTAGDGYSIEVPNHILTNRKLILAYKVDGDYLPADEGPIRVFIPEERSMYWVRNTITVSLNRSSNGGSVEAGLVEKVVFFESLLPQLELLDYIGEAGAKAVKTADVLKDVGTGSLVHMLAVDGFAKNEELATFIELFLVVSGADAPAFRGPDLPQGMHVKYLVALTTGDTGFLFVERGLEYFEPTQVAEREGISLKDIVEALALKDAETYILEAADGYTVEVSGEDLATGIIYLQDGKLTSFFEGLPKNTGVRDLLSISAMD